MNSLIMQLKVKKAGLEKEFSELEIAISRYMTEIVEKSTPYFDELEDIKIDEIKQAVKQLDEALTNAIEIQKKITKINKELGE